MDLSQRDRCDTWRLTRNVSRNDGTFGEHVTVDRSVADIPDVIIVGGGGSGLAAGVSCLERGLNVLLL
ncbi:MAG TPA: FAD-binding protein, partial [Planctomycetes bacterium]|nr:FAD-binding protein [Planctomycetota bacterium]